eukprot:5876860-Prymnesium_polylepis.1
MAHENDEARGGTPFSTFFNTTCALPPLDPAAAPRSPCLAGLESEAPQASRLPCTPPRWQAE